MVQTVQAVQAVQTVLTGCSKRRSSGLQLSRPGRLNPTILPVSKAPPHPPITRRQSLQALAGFAAAAACGHSIALDAAAGPVVLVITGRVRQPNAGTSAQFDMPMLERLPQHSFSTRTPWYASVRRFTGPLLRDVLAAAGASGRSLRVTALNDYRVDVPWDDAQRHDLTLARLLDGQPMAVRDKGPLFMLYPFDAEPNLRSAVYYSRSAWQLKSIEVS